MNIDLTPLFISLKTATCATVIALITGTMAAWGIFHLRGKVKACADGILTLPLVLPPTVLGFFLLVLFGKHHFLGRILGMFDISIIFSWSATVIAAASVAFPLVYRTVLASFEQLDVSVIHAARTLGLGEFLILYRIMVPGALPGIAAGGILAFARALGEFGATMMIAGNIPGRTQTIPVAIYFASEGGNMYQAGIWVCIIVLLSFITVAAMNMFTGKNKKMGYTV
jgi:molybdate transport system permease protein